MYGLKIFFFSFQNIDQIILSLFRKQVQKNLYNKYVYKS